MLYPRVVYFEMSGQSLPNGDTTRLIWVTAGERSLGMSFIGFFPFPDSQQVWAQKGRQRLVLGLSPISLERLKKAQKLERLESWSAQLDGS